jgi:hypothetical protein
MIMNTVKATIRRVRSEIFGGDITELMDNGVDLEWR